MTALVTPAEIIDTLGLSVSATDIASAQLAIQTAVGRDLSDSSVFRPKDLSRLRTAVIWQVAYQDKNPDALHRAAGVASASANGASISYQNTPGADPTWLAPLAAKALTKLSWNRLVGRSIMPTPWRGGLQANVQDTIHDGDDADWKPLGGTQ